jgi:hypothetical protein
MRQSNSVFRMSLLAASIALSLMNTGCGGAQDATAAVTETAVAGTDATTLNLEETSKRRRDSAEPATTASTSISSAKMIPASTASAPIAPTTTAPTTIAPTTSTAPSTASVIASNATTSSTGTASATPRPLVQAQDLVYEGAFRFPALPYTGNVCDSLAYAARGVAFDQDGNNGQGSLFVTGHDQCGARVAEVSIPSAVNTTNLAALPRSQMLQVKPNTLVDALEGKLAQSGISGGTATTVNGLLVHNGQLAISAGNDYSYSQPVSHWTRPKDLSITGQVSNPMIVVGDKGYSAARATAGYMCNVPVEFQTIIGGPALTGWVAASIVSATSDGPAAFAFDPNALTFGANVSATTLLYYPHGYSLEKSVPGESNQIWNWTSMVRGCAIPSGTNSVLFMGSHGSGEFQYGVGGVNGHTNTTPQIPIYDPSDSSTGEHAWPYRYQVWAYDVNELAKAKTGIIKPYEVKPYSVWSFKIPFEDQNGRHNTGGIAYNPKTKQLYFVQSNAGPYGEPVVHVFKISNATPTAALP